LNIAIFGLGYVGSVSAACIARNGHRIIGVDVQPEKVNQINAGKSPIIEPGLAELIHQGVSRGCLAATTYAARAVAQSDLVMVCVGTPSQKNGSLDLSYVNNVCRDIGEVLAHKTGYTVVVIRSTVLPGSTTQEIIPTLEAASGQKAGDGFGFCLNPEFLREGSAIRDFDQPPYTVIGALDDRSAAACATLYDSVDAPLYQVALGTAEMVKYASNAFHALKVAFANEIGNVSQAYGIDSHQVMDIFVQDSKLNLSPYYLKPGFAFGGSCLPKDLRALQYAARQADVAVPVLNAILPSNELQTQKALDMLLASGKRKVALIGLSFKAQTDDLRESPAVELAERLIGKGFELAVYDREVSLSGLYGSNRSYIEQVIPHIGSLMQSSLSSALQRAEVVVVTKRPSTTEYKQLLSLLTPDQVIIDLVRLDGRTIPEFQGSYHGICW
jgi:GDP-mannose 6-dehydrogenase